MKTADRYTLKSFIKDHIILLILLALVTALGYGFTATHYAIGIDNTNHQYYLDGGGILAQGRMTLPLLDKILIPLNGIPFWANAAGTLILYAAAVVWCYYLKIIGGEKATEPALTVFAALMISYPIINESFIYNPFSFPISYLLTGIALIFMHELWARFNLFKALKVFIVLFFLVSLNESFVPVFLIGLFMFMLMDAAFSQNGVASLKRYISFFLIAMAILAAAVFAEAAANVAVRRLLHITAASGANNDIEWLQDSLMPPLQSLMTGLFYRYFLASFWYYPIAALNIAGVLMAVVAVVLAIRQKKPVIILLLLGFMLSVASLALVKGHVTPYRTCSTFALVVAFTAMLVMMLLKRRWMTIAFGILMILLVINQTRILNNWFVNDYQRYEKDKEIALIVAEDIEREFDDAKPVVFSGMVSMAPQVKAVSKNGLPFINWGITQGNGRSFDLHTFLYMHGHSFVIATEDQAREGRKLAESMPMYPKEGYIADTGAYLLVNLGDQYEERLTEKEQAVYNAFIGWLSGYSPYTREEMAERVNEAIKS